NRDSNQDIIVHQSQFGGFSNSSISLYINNTINTGSTIIFDKHDEFDTQEFKGLFPDSEVQISSSIDIYASDLDNNGSINILGGIYFRILEQQIMRDLESSLLSLSIINEDIFASTPPVIQLAINNFSSNFFPGTIHAA